MAAVAEDFPAIGRNFCVDRDDDALAAKTLGAGADEFRRRERAGVDADFVGAGVEHGVHIVRGADAAADGERHEALLGGALDHVDHRCAAVRGRGDVEEDHLVGALRVVTQREFHGVADVSQAAFLGASELDSAGDFAVVNVKARNDTFSQHCLDL